MKNLDKLWLGILAIMLVFSGCQEETDPGSGPGPGPGGTQEYGPIAGTTVVRTMEFEENTGWNESGNESWARWKHEYQDTDDLFDLSDMLDNDKVYILSYSFSSNIDIDELSVIFWNMDHTDWNWQQISNYVKININTPTVNGGTLYSSTIVLSPQTNAAGLDPEFTFLCFYARNRNVTTTPILYFYLYSLVEVNKENPGLDEWTVSGKTFSIDERTKAEKLSSFESKSDVLHIKTYYSANNYGDFVIQYDLNDYAGKTINIEMSMDVYLKKGAWVAWQINSSPVPFYPVVCGTINGTGGIDENGNPSGPVLSANTWHSLTGSYTFTVPNTPSTNDNGKQLYLSGQQIKGAEAYFANATITITEQP